jgi:hypothetical protein
VYHLQILTKAHLALMVGAKTLQAWVESSPKHGKLQTITPELWSWTIEDKNDVHEANVALFKANLLAAWDPKHAAQIY